MTIDMLSVPMGRPVVVPRPDGTRLHALDAGPEDGPPVVLAHGYGASIQEWSLVQPALVERGLRVIAYDHRAHGGSTLGSDGISSRALFEDLIAVVEHFDLSEVVLVGHSMGTFAAMGALAHARLRERTLAVVLVSPETGTLLKGAGAVKLLAPLAQLGLLSLVCRNRPLGIMSVKQVCGPDASAEVLEATRRMLASPSRVVSKFMSIMNKESVESALPSIDVPVKVVWGTEDGATPRWHAELIAERVVDAELVLIEGVGHMPNWEAPERVVEVVEAAVGARAKDAVAA